MLTPAIGPGLPAGPTTPPRTGPSIVAQAPGILPGARRHERFHIHSATLNVLVGRAVVVTGRIKPALRAQRISLRALRRGRWVVIASARTGADGRFRLRYRARALGTWPIEVSFRGGADADGTVRHLGILTSFRVAIASWYGGGGPLACGGYLTSSTIGVANKTLPCGTWLTLRYGARSVRVQVIDRGPFVPGREFDLTEATKQVLGFSGVGPVWASR